MSEWKETTLNEVADVIPGFAFKGEDFGSFGNHVIKIKDIKPPVVDIENSERIDIGKYKNIDKFRIHKNDFVIAMTGATIGKVGRVTSNEVAYINQRVAKIVPNKNVDWNYIYYIVSTNDFYQHIINHIDSNSAQENISSTSIAEYKFKIPSIEIQKIISSILSSIDNKIDILNRQNAILEKMAETLFWQWFIVEAKDNWKEVKLKDYAKITLGTSYKGEFLSECSSDALVTLKCFKIDGKFSIEGYKPYNGDFKSSQTVSPCDIVIACTDITQNADVIGNVGMIETKDIYNNLIITMDLVKINSETIPKYFLYYLLKNKKFKEFCVSNSNGSTVLHLNKKSILDYLFLLPQTSLMSSFSCIASILKNKQFDNSKQIRTLERLRDTLLPKLMSGEIRVKCDEKAL